MISTYVYSIYSLENREEFGQCWFVRPPVRPQGNMRVDGDPNSRMEPNWRDDHNFAIVSKKKYFLYFLLSKVCIYK